MRGWHWLVISSVLLLASGGVVWSLLPDEPDEVIVEDDTGMSDETTDQLLQEIGYLKGTPEGKTP